MKTGNNVLGKASSLMGFSRPSNLILFIIFGGALIGFTLARFHYLSFDGIFCGGDDPKAVPGECYWWRQDLYHAGLLLHLACIIPAAFLAAFQFVPAIRHRWILFHRINGTVVVLLVLVANAGALIIANKVFGGAAATQGVSIAAVTGATVGVVTSYYNIKRLQIDQHRAWMLRAWAYLSHVITERLILLAAVRILSQIPHPLYETRSCVEMATVAGLDFLTSFYPECAPGYPNSTTPGYFTARVNVYSANPFEVLAANGAGFPMAAWFALAIHAVLVELYIGYTPREAERLRNISAERQRERGITRHSGKNFFDAKWDDSDVQPSASLPTSAAPEKGEWRTQSQETQSSM